ncbi:MAG: hypothetical protein M1832_003369 [Thelocarpon impressellum]|nr:MAG: hypothetical protein M1832_003369 [Thelocarpon impressellum]
MRPTAPSAGPTSSPFNNLAAISTVHDISPPSSSGTNSAFGQSTKVSPVEESPTTAETEKRRWGKGVSSIPVLRRAKKLGSHTMSTASSASSSSSAVPRLGSLRVAPATERDSVVTRWDDFTGEPKFKESRPPSSQDDSPSSNPIARRQVGHKATLSGSKATFAERVRMAHEKAMSEEETEGFVAVKGSPARRPTITSPRESANAVTPAAKVTGLSNASTLVSAWETKEPSPTTQAAFPDIKPTPPLKLGKNSPPRRADASVAVSHSQMSSMDLGVSEATNPTGPSEKDIKTAMKDLHAGEQPISRFSGTTHAGTPVTPVMSTTPLDSPREPSLLSVLSRPRPVPNRDSAVSKAAINRDSGATKTPLSRVGSTPSPGQTPSPKFKSLPQSPAEAASVDLISSLEAQLENLHTRRRNLQRIIRDLDRVLPPNSPTHLSWELDRNANDCKAELAEVALLEHELGIRLHRAWKRKDREGSTGEPTGLWVRRAVGG